MVPPAGQRGFGKGRWEATDQRADLGLHCQSVTGPIEFFTAALQHGCLAFSFSNPCMAS